MAAQAVPAPSLVVVQPALAFGVLIELLNRPATMRAFDQTLQRCVIRQIAEIPFRVAALTGQRALTDQPAFHAGDHPLAAGRQVRPTRCPMHQDGDTLLAQRGPVALTPGNRLPLIQATGR